MALTQQITLYDCAVSIFTLVLLCEKEPLYDSPEKDLIDSWWMWAVTDDVNEQ